jgi:hypothetical protein
MPKLLELDAAEGTVLFQAPAGIGKSRRCPGLARFADATTDGESAGELLRRIVEERPLEASKWLQPVLARLASIFRACDVVA